MKNLFAVLALLAFTFSAFSQSLEEPISVVKKKKFYQEEKLLTGDELKYILTSNPASAVNYQSFRTQSIVSQSILITGLGVGLGGLLLLDNLTLGVIGIGIELVALPIAISARNKLVLAVDQHNSSLSSYRNNNLNFELMATAGGIGVRMRF